MLFKLLCMERKSFPQAVDEMMAYYHLSAETADHMGSTILAEVVDCGHRQGHTVGVEDNDVFVDHGRVGSSALEENERVVLFQALFQRIVSEDSAHAPGSLFDLDFKLSGQDKILLKLCYQDGFSVTKAGEMVGLTPHQTHGRMRRLLGRIKKILSESGLAASIEPFLVA